MWKFPVQAPFSSYKQIRNIPTMIRMKSHYLYVSVNSCAFQSRFKMLTVIFPSDFCVMSVALCYYLLYIIRKARKGFTRSGLNKGVVSHVGFHYTMMMILTMIYYYHFYLNSCWNWSYQVSDASCWIRRIHWISPCAFCHRQARNHHHHLL